MLSKSEGASTSHTAFHQASLIWGHLPRYAPFQTPWKAFCWTAQAPAQEVERECAAACASLAMPMPLNVSLRAEDLSQLQHHLLELLQRLEPPVPFTPSLKVLQPLLDVCCALPWLPFPDSIAPRLPNHCLVQPGRHQPLEQCGCWQTPRRQSSHALLRRASYVRDASRAALSYLNCI